MIDQGNVLSFGKHKGRLIEELLIDDPGYLEWLAGQDWFREKYITLHRRACRTMCEREGSD